MKLTEKNFNEYYEEKYTEMANYINENLTKLNELLVSAGKQALQNPTISHRNALLRAYKFCEDENNLKEYNLENCGKLLFDTMELALYTTYSSHETLFFCFFQRIDLISDLQGKQIKRKIMFKQKNTKENLYSKLLLEYSMSEDLLKSFEDCNSLLQSFDPKKDLGNYVTYCLNNMLNIINDHKNKKGNFKEINAILCSTLNYLEGSISSLNNANINNSFKEDHDKKIKYKTLTKDKKENE